MQKAIPLTEGINPASKDLDTKSIAEIIEIMNNEDKKAVEAVYQVRDGIEKDEEARIKAKMRGQAMDSLIESNQFDVPQSMVNKQRDFLLEELKKKYKKAGREIDKEIQQGPALAEDLEKRALQQVKGAMILMEIANKEGLKVTDSDLDERFSSMASETNIDAAEVKSYYEKNKLMDAMRREILDDKIFDFVISRANVVEK